MLFWAICTCMIQKQQKTEIYILLHMKAISFANGNTMPQCVRTICSMNNIEEFLLLWFCYLNAKAAILYLYSPSLYQSVCLNAVCTLQQCECVCMTEKMVSKQKFTGFHLCHVIVGGNNPQILHISKRPLNIFHLFQSHFWWSGCQYERNMWQKHIHYWWAILWSVISTGMKKNTSERIPLTVSQTKRHISWKQEYEIFYHFFFSVKYFEWMHNIWEINVILLPMNYEGKKTTKKKLEWYVR